MKAETSAVVTTETSAVVATETSAVVTTDCLSAICNSFNYNIMDEVIYIYIHLSQEMNA